MMVRANGSAARARIARAAVQGRFWRRLRVFFVLVAAGWTCGDGEPTVGAVDVVPPLVYVRPEGMTATTFLLEARLWTSHNPDRKGIPASDATPLTWTSNKPWLEIKGSTGHTVTLEVKPGYSDADREAVVTATADGRSSDPSARVLVLTDGMAPGNDTLRALFTPDLLPNVAVVAGLRAGSPDCPESLFAFVRTSPLGQLQQKCGIAVADAGNAAVLAMNEGMSVWSENWTPVDNAVSAAQSASRLLPVSVWVAIRGGDDLNASGLTQLRQLARDFAHEEVRDANTILAASRVGVLLDTVGASQLVTDPDELNTIGINCWDADSIETSFTAGVINIYFVDQLQNNYRGLECARHQTRSHPAILLGWNNHAPTALVHEIGHALGLTFPGNGHPYDEGHAIIAGFDITNVMTGYLDPTDARGRDRFTVGQAFRMNADSASWLNVARKNGLLIRPPPAPRLGCQCRADTLASPCPAMRDDAASLGPAPGTFERWMCSDEIELTGPSQAGDEPQGLAAGRRWRARPGVCSADVPGRTEERWDETRIYLPDNLTRPGSCPSWIAVFFRKHAPIYQSVEETPDGWLEIRDEIKVWNPPESPWDVPLKIWYATDALQATALEDLSKAIETFGESNRTGITLVPTWQKLPTSTNPSCAPSHFALDTINIYYATAFNAWTGPADGRLCPGATTKIVVINTGVHHHSMALAHYVGRVLGLDQLKSATTSNGFTSATLAGNLMRRKAANRGPKLTLGQVFRIHYDASSWLNGSPASPRVLEQTVPKMVLHCGGADRKLCPKPGAVVAPP